MGKVYASKVPLRSANATRLESTFPSRSLKPDCHKRYNCVCAKVIEEARIQKPESRRKNTSDSSVMR